MTLRARFRLAHVVVPLAACALVAALFLLPAPSLHGGHIRPDIPEADWGHVRAYPDSHWDVLLGPAPDARRIYEVGLGSTPLGTPTVYVADDMHGKNAHPVPGDIEAGCLYHAQGWGINLILAIGKCVPGWATVTGDPQQHHAKEWLRVQNTSDKPKVVQLQLG